MTNALAYNGTESITAIKNFIVQIAGVNLLRFLRVYYNVCHTSLAMHAMHVMHYHICFASQCMLAYHKHS